MWVNGPVRGLALLAVWAGVASGQALPTTAKIDSVPLELTAPERYQVAEILEPIRRVTLVAPADGFIRSMESRLGTSVRESQEIAQLDRTEAAARLKMAAAEVKEKESLVPTVALPARVLQAQVEAAQARAELAQLALDRCTIRAPFGGRLVALPVCAGQYVIKGTTIAELADVASLKTLVPVDRRSVAAGAGLTVQIEGQDFGGKVMAILPLPDQFFTLRELATPFAAAWISVPNPRGELEPGLRVRPTTIPLTPIATVPKRAVKHEAGSPADGGSVQVIRNEYVTNIPVRVLGDTGPDRSQITGPLRRNDALIVSTSVQLLAGTLVRFSQGAAMNRGTDGASSGSTIGGDEAALTDPSGPRGRERSPNFGRSNSGVGSTQPRPASPPPTSSSAPF
jgi:multidrug efflux pump subunit AcrA (membrane-fusion protein)